MAFCELRWFSNVLGKQVGTNVILPDTGKPPFATYYLLHGLSDDYTIWHRRTRIEWYAKDYPLIIVMPDGFRNFYTNNESGPQYAKYIGEELVAMIERTFPARRDRGGRCVGGLSMGGYGAMRVGLGYADKFASLNSHSGALGRGHDTTQPSWFPEALAVFGTNPKGSDHDLLELARRAKAKKILPKILIDCGKQDYLLKENRQMHRDLTKMKIPHTYREFPGVHDWPYWDEHVQEALKFHAGTMKLK